MDDAHAMQIAEAAQDLSGIRPGDDLVHGSKALPQVNERARGDPLRENVEVQAVVTESRAAVGHDVIVLNASHHGDLSLKGEELLLVGVVGAAMRVGHGQRILLRQRLKKAPRAVQPMSRARVPRGAASDAPRAFRPVFSEVPPRAHAGIPARRAKVRVGRSWLRGKVPLVGTSARGTRAGQRADRVAIIVVVLSERCPPRKLHGAVSPPGRQRKLLDREDLTVLLVEAHEHAAVGSLAN
eukprot:scaffold1090_cov265-Pinguiococcus_pyrenoidosus.AAC.29